MFIFMADSYPFFISTYYIKWVTTSWTHSKIKIKINVEYSFKLKFMNRETIIK